MILIKLEELTSAAMDGNIEQNYEWFHASRVNAHSKSNRRAPEQILCRSHLT